MMFRTLALAASLVTIATPALAARAVKTVKPTISAAPAPAPARAPAPSASAKLDVRFTGIQTPKGPIMFVVFDSEAAYNGQGAPVRAFVATVKDGVATQSVEGLPAGRYAIKAFHDIDGDGNMTANPFGMPVEPFAFSNNAKGDMGPATWAQAAFDIGITPTIQTIEIK